jgi:hypothetical protein
VNTPTRASFDRAFGSTVSAACWQMASASGDSASNTSAVTAGTSAADADAAVAARDASPSAPTTIVVPGSFTPTPMPMPSLRATRVNAPSV